MTQRDLAQCAGITQDWISHFESGRRLPSMGLFCRLANALEVTGDSLLKDNNKTPKGKK